MNGNSIIVLAFGSLGLECLKHLLNKSIPLRAVFTHSDDQGNVEGITSFCRKAQIPVYHWNPNKETGFSTLSKLRPDILFTINYRLLLTEKVLSLPTKACMNIHASLLPRYRGRAPHVWAIINGETETGITVHKVDAGMDTGDILIQNRIPIKETDSIGVLWRKIEEMYPSMVESAIVGAIESSLTPRAQDHSKATYGEKRTAADGEINWSEPALVIYNWIRALSHPFPGAFSYVDNKKLIIWGADLFPFHAEGFPGEIVGNCLSAVHGKMLPIVVCGDEKALLLHEVQPDPSHLTIDEDLSGHTFSPLSKKEQ